MDVENLFKLTDFCHSCFCHEEALSLQKLSPKHGPMVALFQDGDLILCTFCKKQAEYFESFIQNVTQAQKLFQGVGMIEASTLHTIKAELALPTKSLAKQTLESIDVGFETDESTSIAEGNYIVYSCNKSRNVDVKLVVKQESSANDLDDGFLDEDDLALSYHSIKDETNPQTIKQEVEAEEILDKYAIIYTKKKKRKSKEKIFSRVKKRTKGILPSENESENKTEAKEYDADADYCEVVHISREECLREREQLAQDEKYLRQPHKCTDCVKGYPYRDTYEKHMKRFHDKAMGKFICSICKQRRDTYEKLKFHSQYHKVRYRCRHCGLTRSARRTIEQHYVTVHSTSPQIYICPTCSKTYKRAFSLRKHIRYVHCKTRVVCEHCQKSYANKEVLRKHMMEIHIKEELPLKIHVCDVCDKCFKAPSLLKKHMIKHTDRKDFYCVECDKSFKSDTILKHHLKTATPHVNYLDLHHPCLLCEKRFSNRRDLDNHMNSQHLKVKPFQCDKCDRSYVSKWSLKDHKRLAHDGYKRPLAFPCPMCDKVFDRNQIRKAHIRTHTGERPYACAACPASFAQASVRSTHVKLVHLKLTRDGQAKQRLK